MTTPPADDAPAAPCLGIDLGTTHSLVAVLGPDGPRVLPDLDGETLTPSVVALDDDGEEIVGVRARERLLTHPGQAVARFKPSMGTDDRLTLGGRGRTAVELSSRVLRHLKEGAEAALGQPVEQVVLTVPAWFREPQRKATLDAAVRAGLSVTRLINEPTAAALAHGLTAGEEPTVVVVLDLGGGTFDVSILELFDGVVEVRASVGDVHLGGEDFTDAVVHHLRTSLPVVRLDAGARAAMRHEAERAKRALAEAEAVPWTWPPAADLPPLTREAFDLATASLRGRVLGCLREAMVQAGVRPPEVDDVLLVGGATRMPSMHALVRDTFGKDPRTDLDVDRVVALGAAVQAGLVGDHAAVRELLVTDVLTHSLGVAVRREFYGKVYLGRFDPILPRGTILPATRVSRYDTVDAFQTDITIKVYEGEHRECRHNHLLGTLRVEGLPKHDDPEARESVDVRFSHDASGLLRVEAKAVSTGETVTSVLERGGIRLDEAARAEAEAVLERLSVPPRELLPNKHLLERAAQVVVLITGPDRDALDGALTAFEGALDAEDALAIATWRERLGGLVQATIDRHSLDVP